MAVKNTQRVVDIFKSDFESEIQATFVKETGPLKLNDIILTADKLKDDNQTVAFGLNQMIQALNTYNEICTGELARNTSYISKSTQIEKINQRYKDLALNIDSYEQTLKNHKNEATKHSLTKMQIGATLLIAVITGVFGWLIANHKNQDEIKVLITEKVSLTKENTEIKMKLESYQNRPSIQGVLPGASPSTGPQLEAPAKVGP